MSGTSDAELSAERRPRSVVAIGLSPLEKGLKRGSSGLNPCHCPFGRGGKRASKGLAKGLAICPSFWAWGEKGLRYKKNEKKRKKKDSLQLNFWTHGDSNLGGRALYALHDPEF